MDSIPSWGTEIPQAVQYGQNLKQQQQKKPEQNCKSQVTTVLLNSQSSSWYISSFWQSDDPSYSYSTSRVLHSYNSTKGNFFPTSNHFFSAAFAGSSSSTRFLNTKSSQGSVFHDAFFSVYTHWWTFKKHWRQQLPGFFLQFRPLSLKLKIYIFNCLYNIST